MRLRMKGKTVVDATKQIKTTITATDLAKAIPTDPSHCAIAESLRRRNGIESISIGASKVYVIYTNKPDEIVRYDLPRNERALIRAFDLQGAFPCGYTVTLDPVPDGRKIGARSGERHGTNTRSGKGNSALHRAGRRTPTRHVATPA